MRNTKRFVILVVEGAVFIGFLVSRKLAIAREKRGPLTSFPSRGRQRRD